MYRDEIIAEVWRLRDAYVESHGHDLSRIVADLRGRQKHPHSELVDRRERTSDGRSRRAATTPCS